MPCENNHSAICNSSQKIYYGAYIFLLEFLALRTIFLDDDDHPFKKLPVTYTYDDLYSTMINLDDELVLRFEYKHYSRKSLDFLSSAYSIEVDPKDMFQYLLCKGLLLLILFILESL